MKVLKEHNAKATFFMLGNQVDDYPNLSLKVAEDDHEIGKTHPDISKKSTAKIQKEINI
ncbi:polysaccharide deacetylase family protein [Pseudogracilibacillus sp. SO30301A]|uniref:polysaccharide deacetylase family protein n=1 Tax=Pseudogracilibacillus sp. SO30301A TaxID=3098291 RepID=UPI00300E3321